MDAIVLHILNGLDKGGAYALIALGLALIFGTLGVVNFAHGALFMIGAFCAVSLQRIFSISRIALDPEKRDFPGWPLMVETPYLELWFGEEVGRALIDWSVPLSILLAIPVTLLIGYVMERGVLRRFCKRPHADQILVTFGLAIVLQEIVKAAFGANPIPAPAPAAFAGSVDFGAMLGMEPNAVIYPCWRLVYFLFSATVIGAVFSFLRFTTFGMVMRAGMADRETVGLLGVDIDRGFTMMFGVATVVAGVAGALYAPIDSPNYHMGVDFLALGFVVVVVGGMGSLPGAVIAGFLLGVVESFASAGEVEALLPGVDQVAVYLVAIVFLLTRPRSPIGRGGAMEV